MNSFLYYLDTFSDLYKETTWMETAVESEITYVFKLGNFLEKLYCCLKAKHTAAKCDNIIHMHWKCTTQDRPLKVTSFKLICDLMLIAFLNNQKVNTNNVLLAIKQYIHFCDKNRFEVLIHHLIVERISFKTLFHTISHEQQDAMSPLYSNALISSWCEKVEGGSQANIVQVIGDMLSDPQQLEFLMKVLVTYKEEKRSLTILILEEMLLKMNRESELCHQFWRKLIAYVDKQLILSVCKDFPQFLSLLLNIIVIVSKDMVLHCSVSCEGMRTLQYKWTSSSSNPVLQGTEFDGVVELIRYMLKSKGIVGNSMRDRLDELKRIHNCTLWEDMEAVYNVVTL